MNKSSPVKQNNKEDSAGSTYIAPRNKTAAKAFHEHYGKCLAEEKILELKSARFGNTSQFDRYADTIELPSREGYTNITRKDSYKKALSLYNESEIVRPIINLISSAIFSSSLSNQRLIDITGKREDLIETAKKIIDNNALNFHDLAREAELAGDVFLHFIPNGDRTEIISLDAGSVESVLKNDNVRRVTGYEIQRGAEDAIVLPSSTTQQLKINSTTTSQYGRSSLRNLFYWFDVQDSLFEKNWLRGAQYFGNPQLKVTGVPGPYQAKVRTQLEQQTQRAGRVLILPPDADAGSIDYSLDFPIGDIVGWVFRLISIGSEIPITLLGTADAGSRGSAFFANPRFTFAIRAKREVWRIGLRELFIKIFRKIKVLNDTETLTCEDFNFGFFSIFDKDFSELADIIEVYRENKMVSIKTAQRMMGFDSEQEAKNMEEEPEDAQLTLQKEQQAADIALAKSNGNSRNNGNRSTKEERDKRRKKRRVSLED